MTSDQFRSEDRHDNPEPRPRPVEALTQAQLDAITAGPLNRDRCELIEIQAIRHAIGDIRIQNRWFPYLEPLLSPDELAHLNTVRQQYRPPLSLMDAFDEIRRWSPLGR